MSDFDPNCVTCHSACDCREEKIKEIRALIVLAAISSEDEYCSAQLGKALKIFKSLYGPLPTKGESDDKHKG